MAVLHQATLTPTKAELVSTWLPRAAWFDGERGNARPVGAYRFDDPAGEVGIESHLFDVDGALVHVPLTYRAQPLAGAEDWLVGTMEHSVLGTRWVYDALGDPVYLAEVTRVIRDGDQQVRMWVETPQGQVERQPTMQARGSGQAGPESALAVVVRHPGTVDTSISPAVLTGTWDGQDEPVVLVYLTA